MYTFRWGRGFEFIRRYARMHSKELTDREYFVLNIILFFTLFLFPEFRIIFHVKILFQK